MKIIRFDRNAWWDEPNEKEVSVLDLFNDLSDSINNNKRYGQIEKLDAKINILFSVLASQINNEEIVKVLTNIASNEIDGYDYKVIKNEKD